MVLHALLDLPAELLLEIIVILHAQPISKNESRIRLLWPLSETCKQLNGCCGLWIFARYHLCLRTSSDKRFTLLTPLRISESLRHWNLDAVKARLLHFREKASCVRELILEDIKDREEEEPEIFPDCILFDLIDVLKYAHKLTSIEVTFPFGATRTSARTVPWIFMERARLGYCGGTRVTILRAPSTWSCATTPGAIVAIGIRKRTQIASLCRVVSLMGVRPHPQ